MLFLSRLNLLAVVSLAVGSARAAAGPVDPMTALVNNLSDECTMSAVQLLASDLATCSDAVDFMTVLAAQSNLPQNLTVWLHNLCKYTCPSKALSEARLIVTNGCSKDLNDPNSLPSLVIGAIDNYSILRHGACAFDTNTNTNCLVNFATTYEKYSQKSLTLSWLFLELRKNVASLSVVPPAELCVDCNKVLYTFSYDLLVNSTADQNAFSNEATTVCPASFTDRTDPSTLTFVGETPGSNSNSSATAHGTCPNGSSAKSSGCPNAAASATTKTDAPATTSAGSRPHCSSSTVGGSLLVVIALIGGLSIL